MGIRCLDMKEFLKQKNAFSKITTCQARIMTHKWLLNTIKYYIM
jgi:hypothetical protein